MDILSELRALSSKEKAAFFPRFFKTGKGEYGEGDVFIGVTVPNIRLVAKKYTWLSLEEIHALLHNPIHEVRLAALVLLVGKYQKADVSARQEIADFYLAHTERINNWDLVDASCYHILGDHLLDKDRSILYSLAKSTFLWERRIAMVSTLAFIRKNQFDDTQRIAELLLEDKHDLIHKAVGWMLREMGKKNVQVLESFLDAHVTRMPRTSLRYAIEKLPSERRRHYLEHRSST